MHIIYHFHFLNMHFYQTNHTVVIKVDNDDEFIEIVKDCIINFKHLMNSINNILN